MKRDFIVKDPNYLKSDNFELSPHMTFVWTQHSVGQMSFDLNNNKLHDLVQVKNYGCPKSICALAIIHQLYLWVHLR